MYRKESANSSGGGEKKPRKEDSIVELTCDCGIYTVERGIQSPFLTSYLIVSVSFFGGARKKRGVRDYACYGTLLTNADVTLSPFLFFLCFLLTPYTSGGKVGDDGQDVKRMDLLRYTVSLTLTRLPLYSSPSSSPPPPS